MSRMRTSALVLFAAAGLALASAPAAQASPAQLAGATAKARGNAPSCVTVWENVGVITKTGYARNDCGSSLNLKIVWAHGSDGPCRTVRAGYTLSNKIPRGPRTFDGADTC
ncbi:hypothetical protein AB0395_01995 [Streptosporangium sp. NPDC051023]|uniref:hypothetical protein n=1 Tax=Streptosporangium sp. NPDC051023 TaxID=3155410 RepID=UPI00344FBBD9